MNPGPGIQIKEMPKEKLIDFIGNFVKDSKLTVVNEGSESDYASKRYLTSQILREQENFTANAWMKAIRYYGWIVGTMTVFSLLMKYKFYFVRMINWFKERYVTGPAEETMNQQLFIGQKGDEPAFAMYDKVTRYIKHVSEGRANALVIYGPPGMSKTYIVRRTFHFQGLKPLRDYSIEKGSTLGLASTFYLLYKNRNKILVLDDFDKPLQDADTVNLLKACTDTYGIRILSLPTEKKMSSDDTGKVSAIPSKFEFRGKIIIITNIDKRNIDKALLSRAPAIEANYNSKEVIKSLETLLKFINPSAPMALKEEVYNYIIKLRRDRPNKVKVDFRAFQSAVDARIGNPEGWVDMVKLIVDY